MHALSTGELHVLASLKLLCYSLSPLVGSLKGEDIGFLDAFQRAQRLRQQKKLLRLHVSSSNQISLLEVFGDLAFEIRSTAEREHCFHGWMLLGSPTVSSGRQLKGA
mmetsp:Transcript_113806/g.270977  ORF Transcript_113806/g.270977 Transcript_113806/m.270977 type:complete len:107 (+) Transcript_113806:468-788(+)